MKIKKAIKDSIEVKQKILENTELQDKILNVVKICVSAFLNGNKVLFCGNGGSAADAQHLAAELSGRFYFDRAPLNSEALHVNSSYMTAVANDYSYDEVYDRMIRGMGKKGDVLIGLSTSGNSKNIIRAFETALELGITTVGMTGESGGYMKFISDVLINVPSNDTPRIQESHIMIGHIICELIESNIFSK